MLQNSYSLNSCQGTDLITSTVYLSPNLLGITKAEIIVKYSKPLVTYKGIATPEVAWNFQQLLDSANFLSSTLHSLQKVMFKFHEKFILNKIKFRGLKFMTN